MRALQASSFEERSVDITKYLIELGVKAIEVIHYEDGEQRLIIQSTTNLKRIEILCQNAGVDYKITSSNTLDETLSTKIDNSADIIDVSCFTKFHVLELLERGRKNLKKIIYAPAIRHETTGPAVRQRKIIQIPAYSGKRVANRKDILFILAGFEGNRALSVYKNLAPSLCVLCIGVPWYEPGRLVEYVQTAVKQNSILAASTNVRIETVPSIDAHGFAYRFEFLVKSYTDIYSKEYNLRPNIVAVPLGTKMQAVGLFLAHRHLPEMQILYSIPEKYREIAIGTNSILEIDLKCNH